MDAVGQLPAHGGDLQWAQARFGGPAEQWLDLSTGVSPWAWPVPAVPQAVWQRLPPVDDASLRLAAADFYGCGGECVLPVPGSQFAIAQLPRLQHPAAVALPDPGYQEHARAWAAAGHTPLFYRSQEQLAELIERGRVTSAVVINPNNPTADTVNRQCLLAWRHQLAEHGGLLVVDEAFADVQPVHSLAGLLPLPNLVLLRSLGKFFGLAGVRLGFVLAEPSLLARLQPWCLPWQVSHPAQWIGEQALLDTPWQAQQRRRIGQEVHRLSTLLREAFFDARVADAGLFVTVSGSRQSLYDVFTACAGHRLLLRYGGTTECGEWLRFGLPGNGFERLQATLHKLEFI